MGQRPKRKRTPRPGEVDYDPQYAEDIKRIILEYMEEESLLKPPTRKYITSTLGIKPITLDHWKENYPEVRLALETGLTPEEKEKQRNHSLAVSGANSPNSKYKGLETDELIFNYSLLGARTEDLCKYFNINNTTLYDWFRKYPQAQAAFDRGKDEADSKVARSLYKRATGYTVKRTVHAVFQGQITDTMEIEEEIIPDPSACKYWLSTRQRQKWADNQYQQVQVGLNTDNLGQAILENDTFRQLASALLTVKEEETKPKPIDCTDFKVTVVEEEPE